MMRDTAPGQLGDPNRVRVTRELPLAWILTLVGSIAAQAILLWAGQREQGQQLMQLTDSVRTMSADVKPVSIKVTEHDVRIADHERRLQACEIRQARP